MNKLRMGIVIALAFVTLVLCVDDNLDRATRIENECREEYGVSKDHEAKADEYSDIDKCVLHCFMFKMGLISISGKANLYAYKEVYAEFTDIINTLMNGVMRCKVRTKRGPNPCKTAYEFTKCLEAFNKGTYQ